MKHKWKMHPGEYALGENEKFYSDMEARGWKLVKRGLHLSKFEKAEPSRTPYRVEVAKSDFLKPDSSLPEEQIAVFEDCGWEYVTSRRMLHFFRAPEGSDAPEFYQDPRQQAETLKSVRLNLIAGFLFSLLLIALLIPVMVSFSGGTAGFFGRLRRMLLTAPGLPAFYFLMLLSAVSVSVIDVCGISRIYRRLKKGIPLDHAPKSRGYARLILDRGLWAAAILCLLLTGVQLLTTKSGAMPTEPDGPYIVLADAGREGTRVIFMDGKSRVEHTRSLMAEYWDTREYVDVGGDTDIHLYQEIYRLKSFLSPSDWIRAVAADRSFSESLDDFTPVSIDGLDAAWLAENGIEALAVKGQFMAYIDYLDGAYDKEHLAEILSSLGERWAAFE